MLDLKNVTLNMIETLEHELGRLAVNECVTKANFGQVLIFTDKPELFRPLECDAKFVQVPNWPTKLQWSRFCWHGVAPLVHTAQSLHIQWDSWIWDPSMWRDEFLEFDYCGAPWWYTDGRNVGNGGFALRSAALLRCLYDNRAAFPIDSTIDDDLVCRKYRLALEDQGFIFAPERVAHDFAFECSRPAPNSRHFGFHAAFNFGQVLDHGALLHRARLMCESPYLQKTGYIMKAFTERHPEIIREILDEQPALQAAE